MFFNAGADEKESPRPARHHLERTGERCATDRSDFQRDDDDRLRTYDVRRKTLDREFVPIETSLGSVRMKISRMNGTIFNATPEYEDCQRIAAERKVPLKQVIAAGSFNSKRKEAGR